MKKERKILIFVVAALVGVILLAGGALLAYDYIKDANNSSGSSAPYLDEDGWTPDY